MKFAMFDPGNRVIRKVFITDDGTLVGANTDQQHQFVQVNDDVPVDSGMVINNDGSIVTPPPPQETDAEIVASMLQTIDQEANRRSLAYFAGAPFKLLEFVAKSTEFNAYKAMTASELSKLLLTPVTARLRFPWAFAEIDDTGDTLAVVMNRWATDLQTVSQLRAIATRAQVLKRKINAASPSARAGIFNARQWPA